MEADAGEAHLIWDISICSPEVEIDGTVSTRAHDVVDGQQRLTTLTIALASFTRQMRQTLTGLRKQDDQDDFLLSQCEDIVGDVRRALHDRTDGHWKPRIVHAHRHEREVYDLLCDLNVTPPKEEIHGTLGATYRTIEKWMRQAMLAADIETRTEELIFCARMVHTLLFGVCLFVRNSEYSSSIIKMFQTMNTTSQRLTQMDQVKSLFAQNTPKADFEQMWQQEIISDELAIAASRSMKLKPDHILRYWLWTRTGALSSSSRLYTSCTAAKAEGKIEFGAEDLANLRDFSCRIRRLSEDRIGANAQICVPLVQLGDYLDGKGRQHIPVLIAGWPLEDVDPALYEDLCREVQATVFMTTTSHPGTDHYKDLWPSWANRLRDALARDGASKETLEAWLDTTLRRVREEILPDFRARFRRLGEEYVQTSGRPPKLKHAKFALSVIEEAFNRNNGIATSPDDLRSTLTLEHVFHLKLDAESKYGISQEEFLQLRNTLGNLVLLAQSENSTAADRATLGADPATGRAGKLSAFIGSHFASTRAMSGAYELQRDGRGANATLLKLLPKLDENTRPQDIRDRTDALITALLSIWGHDLPQANRLAA